MIISKEGLSAVPGFKGSGIHCGIKQVKNPDLALIWSETECNAAGVFTQNRVVASSVTITRGKLFKRGKARAIIINSGNANVCTGPEGKRSSLAAIKAAAKALEVSEEDILIASTGKISEPLPIQN
ncbi:MAG TPA: bifunctional ornithine acetyltransferase/N-acetylglutamate synthase, partial [Nitrospiria bacterium]|nr:bifunctional ornithine acetyltransferase/N-acetylglutamate synthase [Nitrospiria bacterium]